MTDTKVKGILQKAKLFMWNLPEGVKINPCERNTGREKTYKFIRKGVFLYLGIDIFLLCNCLMFFGFIAEDTFSPNLVIFAPVCLSNVTLVTTDRKTGTNISEDFQGLESKPLFRLLVRILVKQLAKILLQCLSSVLWAHSSQEDFLLGNWIENHEQRNNCVSGWLLRTATASYLVSSVSPEPMGPRCDAGPRELVGEEEEEPGGEGEGGQDGQPVQGQRVQDHEFHHVSPNDVLRRGLFVLWLDVWGVVRHVELVGEVLLLRGVAAVVRLQHLLLLLLHPHVLLRHHVSHADRLNTTNLQGWSGFQKRPNWKDCLEISDGATMEVKRVEASAADSLPDNQILVRHRGSPAASKPDRTLCSATRSAVDWALRLKKAARDIIASSSPTLLPPGPHPIIRPLATNFTMYSDCRARLISWEGWK